jgi:hypothetical protein
MMTPHRMAQLMRRVPFQTITLWTSDGSEIKIEHPENVQIFNNRVMLAENPDETGFPQDDHHIYYLHIARFRVGHEEEAEA